MKSKNYEAVNISLRKGQWQAIQEAAKRHPVCDNASQWVRAVISDALRTEEYTNKRNAAFKKRSAIGR